MDLPKTESHVNSLIKSLKDLAEDEEFTEFLAIIHKPGFTSVAESLLITGMLESMKSHAQHLVSLKQSLLAGARAVVVK